MTCAGNSSEFCGGGFRLNVYALEGTHEVPELPPPEKEEEEPEVPPEEEEEEDSPPTPTETPTPDPGGAGGWAYLGCYT